MVNIFGQDEGSVLAALGASLVRSWKVQQVAGRRETADATVPQALITCRVCTVQYGNLVLKRQGGNDHDYSESGKRPLIFICFLNVPKRCFQLVGQMILCQDNHLC